jgi:hypothetical protein
MNTIAFLEDAGVKAEVIGNSIKLSGLSKLTPEKKNQVIEHARAHKPNILMAMSQGESSDQLPPLPTACSLVDGGHCLPECRYTNKFLTRMITTGVLPDPNVGCPFRHVCNLGIQLDEVDDGLNSQVQQLRSDKSEDRPTCFNFHCIHAGYQQHDSIEYKWCGLANKPVIELSTCPKNQWHRNKHGHPVHGPIPQEPQNQSQAPTEVISEARRDGPHGDCKNCPAAARGKET